MLFVCPAISIPLPFRTAPRGDAWSIDALPPDSLALISPRAVTRLRRDPRSSGLLAGLISCLALEPCLAMAAEPPLGDAAFVMWPSSDSSSTEAGVQDQAELPDSVFQVSLHQRVSLSLVSGMTVIGTIMAVAESTVTFSAEHDGAISVVRRSDISGIRLLGASQAPPAGTQQPSPQPGPPSPASPDVRLQIAEGDRAAGRGLNWQAYAAYKQALLFSDQASAQTVMNKIEVIQRRMRSVGLGLWIPGTILTLAGLGTSYSYYYGGGTLITVGIPMLVIGAVMHARANKVRQELPTLRRQLTKRTRWNGGLSWSF